MRDTRKFKFTQVPEGERTPGLPSANRAGHAAWLLLDIMAADRTLQPTRADAMLAAEAVGLTPTNISAEYANWRRYHGYGEAKAA